jgi:hypothetical protein
MTWRKSSFSQDINCVELAWPGAIRDSKNPSGPILRFHQRDLARFLKHLKLTA